MERLLTWVNGLVRPDKNQIRERIKKKRLTLTLQQEEEWNQFIAIRVLELSRVAHAFCIYCYVSLLHEAGTEKLIGYLIRRGKMVAVPRVEGKRLAFYAINGPENLESGAMGILEPNRSCIRVCDPTAPVIVPGLAFDQEMHRIGYGGGYYDRFLEEEPLHTAIGIAFPFQMLAKLPAEPHDKAMDEVIVPFY